MKYDEKLIYEFKKEISHEADLVDPNDELDWYSLIVGWAIAKGLTPKDAHEFSMYIRYETDFG